MLDESAHPVVWPGDWEAHDAMWLSWSPVDYTQNNPFHIPFFNMIRALHTRVKLHCLVQHAQEQQTLQSLLQHHAVPTTNLTFHHIPRTGPWARDFGPLFVRTHSGTRLAVVDFDFTSWGYVDQWGEGVAAVDEAVHGAVARVLGVGMVGVMKGPGGVRASHEGGGVVLNGGGTIISVESVAMQRNLGPGRFYPTPHPPTTDYSHPTTYQPTAQWTACRQLLERVYSHSLGARKCIWVPTGVIEDDAPYRGAIAAHLQIDEFDGRRVGHAGVYPSMTTNGHADEFVKWVAEDTVLLAESRVQPLPANPTPVERVIHYIEQQNHTRLEHAYAALVNNTTANGNPIRIVRLPTPCIQLQLLTPADLQYTRLLDLQPPAEQQCIAATATLLMVLPASYANYVVSNGEVLVGQYWREGRGEEVRRRDEEAVRVLESVFPGREVVGIEGVENVNVGGGGMHCITQQQPSVIGRNEG